MKSWRFFTGSLIVNSPCGRDGVDPAMRGGKSGQFWDFYEVKTLSDTLVTRRPSAAFYLGSGFMPDVSKAEEREKANE